MLINYYVHSSFSVSHVTPGDIEGVTNLLAGLDGVEDIISDVTQYTLAKRDPNNDGGTPISAIIAKCSDQVVGVAVVRTEQVCYVDNLSGNVVITVLVFSPV